MKNKSVISTVIRAMIWIGGYRFGGTLKSSWSKEDRLPGKRHPLII